MQKATAPGAIPVRRASHPSSISASSPTNHQRSHSQQSRPQSHPCLYTHAPMTAPPGVDGLSTTHIQPLLHVSTLPQTYHEQLQRHQQQQHLQQLVHGFDPHAQHVIAHAQIAPAPALPSSHPKTRLLVPAQLQTDPQQTQQQQQQQQNMTHTPTTASMLVPATAPVHSSSSTEQTLVQIRAQPPAPAPPTGAPFPLTMQMVSTTRMREPVQTQAVQTHTQQAVAVAGASVDATTSTNTSASAGAGAGSAVQSTPGSGTQTRGPPRPLQMPPAHTLSPVSARAQATLPASSASNTPPSHSQQQQHQRFAVPPALAAFKVLQPAKELLEQTWAAAIAAVQQEFAAVHAELGRSAREKQALTELLQRLQGERMQALHALRNTQMELKQCMGNFQNERRTRVHLERRLAEMTQLIEKCTCGAASAKTSPSTVTPPPLVVLDHGPPAPSPVPSSPASAPVLAKAAEDSVVRTQTPTSAPGSSPRTTTQSSSSPSPGAVRSSVRRYKREEDDAEEGESATKRRRIERTPTPTSPPAPVSEVADIREAPAPVDKTPATQPQALQEQPSPKTAQPETPKTSPTVPRRKIGIQHIQLVYETVGSTLQCRMCLLRKREVDPTTHVTTFPVSAAYPDLVGHCEQEHDAALEALASMSPGEIAEMRQRFQAAQSPQ
ncbi:hypothetical protein H4582DRAFT_2101723 [Lactarius indigo]|nr:hypothetical protein H4582DRAFT_2101723 [Lactarius indigo]